MQHPADLVTICGLLEVLWVAEGGLHGLDQEVVAALVGEADQELHQLTGGQLCGRRADASLSTSTGCSWLYTDHTLPGSPRLEQLTMSPWLAFSIINLQTGY